MRAGAQEKYQVRFGWGGAGLRRTSVGAHLVVWVDVLPDADADADADPDAHVLPDSDVLSDPDPDADSHEHRAPRPDGKRDGSTAEHDAPETLTAGLTDGAAVAERVLRLQAERGDRCVVAVVAADPAGAVEDLLGAGNVVDALVAVGIDHTSPEAAAACAAWAGLHRAAKHLVSASEHAVELEAAGRRDLVDAAIGREHGARA